MALEFWSRCSLLVLLLLPTSSSNINVLQTARLQLKMYPSKIEILPSDVLVMVMDYIDSPSLMNCRQVNKHFLDVIDGNRFLYNFFWVLSKYPRSCNLNMLLFFAWMSRDNIKAFCVPDEAKSYYNPRSDKKAKEANRTMIDTLLRSRNSLQFWFGWHDLITSLFLSESHHFSNLQTFCTNFYLPICFTMMNRKQVSYPSLNRLFGCFNTSVKVEQQQIPALIQATSLRLKYLTADYDHLRTLSFPQILVLQLIRYRGEFPQPLNCPKLQVLSLVIDKEAILGNDFPVSVEEIWLFATSSPFPYNHKMGSLKKNKGLNALKRNYPKLRILGLSPELGIYPAEVLTLLRSRRKAAEDGLMVDGMEIRPIERLVIDFSQIDEISFDKLRDLVPILEDSRYSLATLFIET